MCSILSQLENTAPGFSKDRRKSSGLSKAGWNSPMEHSSLSTPNAGVACDKAFLRCETVRRFVPLHWASDQVPLKDDIGKDAM